MERIAALTPRPRINLILYHGVLAPRAAWRSLVVQFGTAVSPDQNARPDDAQDQDLGAADRPDGSNQHWADLLRRSFGLDVLACPRGGRLTLIALIEDPVVIARFLRHLGLWYGSTRRGGDTLARIASEADSVQSRVGDMVKLAAGGTDRKGSNLRQGLSNLRVAGDVPEDWSRLARLEGKDERFGHTWNAVCDRGAGPAIEQASRRLQAWEQVTDLLGLFLVLDVAFATFEGNLDGAIRTLRLAQVGPDREPSSLSAS